MFIPCVVDFLPARENPSLTGDEDYAPSLNITSQASFSSPPKITNSVPFRKQAMPPAPRFKVSGSWSEKDIGFGSLDQVTFKGGCYYYTSFILN